MVNAVGDRGRHTGETDFADAARAKFVDFLVGMIEEMKPVAGMKMM